MLPNMLPMNQRSSSEPVQVSAKLICELNDITSVLSACHL